MAEHIEVLMRFEVIKQPCDDEVLVATVPESEAIVSTGARSVGSPLCDAVVRVGRTVGTPHGGFVVEVGENYAVRLTGLNAFQTVAQQLCCQKGEDEVWTNEEQRAALGLS